MSWVRIDDGFAENPKVEDLSDKSFRLHVAAMCYAGRNLTDGFVSDRALKVCGVVANTGRPRVHAGELVAAGLWDRVDGGWVIHDFTEYNPTAEEVKDLRRKRAEAGKAGGKERARRQALASVTELASVQADVQASALASGSTPAPPLYVTPKAVIGVGGKRPQSSDENRGPRA